MFRWLKFYCFLALGPKGENVANVKELSDEELLINCLPGHYYLEIKKGHFTTIIQDIDVLGIYVTVGVHDSK